MIVALCGPSCTGKTTIAELVRNHTGLPLRCCGNTVKQKANELGVPVAELPDGEHRAIDAETVRWATSNSPCLVEGRYLQYVLAPIGSQVHLVSLEASDEDRRRRMVKTGRLERLEHFEKAEKIDHEFAKRMYKGRRLRPSLVVNSSHFSVEVCVRSVLEFLRRG
jgi:cytidylate kinase